MSEEIEGAEAGPQASGTPDTAGLAIDLAMEEARTDPSLRDDAAAFLRNQNSLIDIQKHHLHEQFGPQLRQLHLSVSEKSLGVLLRIATAFIGLAIAAGVAFMIWDASHSNGLLIEPFSVPPDLANRGLTGQVVAAKLLDHLSAMQAQTDSARAPATYTSSWGQKDIKLDIPETGLSLAELDGFLRAKLGHDTHITGEIVRIESGLSLTARAGVQGAASVKGAEADLGALVQRAAESVYRLTQPFRYGIYLASHGRTDEALPIFKELAENASDQERNWAYYGWANAIGGRDREEFNRVVKRALQLDPDNVLVLRNGASGANQPEALIRDHRKILSLLSGKAQAILRPDALIAFRNASQASIDAQLGAFHDAARETEEIIRSGVSGLSRSAELARMQTAEHNLAAARATMVDPYTGQLSVIAGNIALRNIYARMVIASEARDWAGVLYQAEGIAPLLPKYPGLRGGLPTTTEPLIAYAQARLGRFAAAEARIAATPADCYPCLRFRAGIAELRGQHGQADYWFARAIAGQQSIPLAYSEWGTALLPRGKPDEAIEKFELASQKGPHFADPLEGWGEALMAKKQSHLALAKFKEAEKYAPNWGRLHLKWAEALVYAAKKNEAKAQFARAAQLDLTPSEKSELAGVH